MIQIVAKNTNYVSVFEKKIKIWSEITLTKLFICRKKKFKSLCHNKETIIFPFVLTVLSILPGLSVSSC